MLASAAARPCALTHDWCALPAPYGLLGCLNSMRAGHSMQSQCPSACCTVLSRRFAVSAPAHTRMHRTQEHHISRCSRWDTLGHPSMRAADRKRRDSLLLLRGLVRERGEVRDRLLRARWLHSLQSPCCPSVRHPPLHAACAGWVGVRECQQGSGACASPQTHRSKASTRQSKAQPSVVYSQYNNVHAVKVLW